MVEDVVADFVGEDDLDLVGREAIQDRVAQQHASSAPQAGQHGVGFDGFLAQTQSVDALDRQPGPFGQPSDALGQLG